ncbi:cytidylate kinase family protein [Candidatus Woesearchaeota archaeon]|nr:cytidylate kinase family protein [Candidatus Woesearchaeota archaeon]
MIVTISGTPGSGKSTVAKLVAKKLGWKHYSMGDLQRQVAEERGISIAKLGELEQTDPSIDREIDALQIRLGKEEEDIIIDSRLGAFFIPHAKLRIFLDADEEERARRILHAERGEESYRNIEEAKEKMQEREEDNAQRYRKFYGIDHRDRKLYTHFLDTTHAVPEQTAEKILLLIHQAQRTKPRNAGKREK